MRPEPALRVGIDTGGTFTDFVVYDPAAGSVDTFKLPSTPHDPAAAVLGGLREIEGRSPGRAIHVVHGSTVATNALLEGKGARTALVATRGFRDVLAIGRQNRPGLYDLTPPAEPDLVPDSLRFEIAERVSAGGEILQPLDPADLDGLLAALRAAGQVESVAVSFLFSFLVPGHEQQTAVRLREAGYFVSASHEILPEFREFERTATTVANACVAPVLDRYLGRLEAGFLGEKGESDHRRLAIMQSNGGTISPARARREAVRCVLSGPAGGLIAGRQLPLPEQGPLRSLLTIDMGGTSTDVSLVASEPRLTTQSAIGGLPIGIPVLDIHTIGAGGGSIARIDPGGGLRVGPESAGADPGPACYGRDPRRRFPTVTDANLILGRLQPDRFLGGRMPLSVEAAEAALQPIAAALGVSLAETASGILRIANAHMVRALRVISVERGHDPADFTLVSFGGAGGLHAVELARELGAPRVLIPAHAAVFSALGMLQADVVKDYVQTVMLPGSAAPAEIEAALDPLQARARTDLDSEGIPEERMAILPRLDVRFRGQSYELDVPYSDSWRTDFLALYGATYGYVPASDALEIVNVRVQARGRVQAPVFAASPPAGPDPSAASLGTWPVWQEPGFAATPVYAGERLSPGNRITGPALVARSDTTIWLPARSRGLVDPFGNLLIEV